VGKLQIKQLMSDMTVVTDTELKVVRVVMLSACIGWLPVSNIWSIQGLSGGIR